MRKSKGSSKPGGEVKASGVSQCVVRHAWQPRADRNSYCFIAMDECDSGLIPS